MVIGQLGMKGGRNQWVGGLMVVSGDIAKVVDVGLDLRCMAVTGERV